MEEDKKGRRFFARLQNDTTGGFFVILNEVKDPLF
jgi:hypothetical protein